MRAETTLARMQARLPAERGVVLLIALILAGLLAVLATGAMQSAAFELASSGQEQARERALQATDSALAQLAAQLIANPSSVALLLASSSCGPLAAATCEGSAMFIATDPAIAAASAGARTGALYTVSAQGRAGRGARVSVEVGWRLVTSSTGSAPEIQRVYWKRSDVD